MATEKKKPATRKRTTTKTARKKVSAKKVTKKTIPVKRKEEPVVGEKKEKRLSELLEHNMQATTKKGRLEKCMAGLYRVAVACRPRSVWGTIGILSIGIALGIVIAVGFIRAHNTGIIPGIIGEKVGMIGGIGPRIDEEIDMSFAQTTTAPENPSDFSDVDLNEMWEVWRNIEEHFVPKPEQYNENRANEETGKPSREELVYGAINGLTFATRDKYTNFFRPEDAQEFEEEVLNGEIDGIGAYLSIIEEQLTIVRTIEGGPAKAKGLRADDIIIEIDGVPSGTYNLSEAARAIRGKRGTTVLLKIYRPLEDREISFSVTRSRVEIPTVESEVIGGVFVIRLTTFTKFTPIAFREALRKFVKQANEGGARKILLDMRGNMGGILQVSVNIAGMFLPKGSPVLYEYTGTEKLKVYRTRTGPIFENNAIPEMTVLVDRSTASASEILAAALRHYGIADIVGTGTMGKGSVQALKKIGGENSLLKITVAHWLTPSKKSIEEDGIVPDIEYKKDLENILKESPETDIDEYMLDKAIRHLINKAP